jgi:diaminopimelate epimerase
LVFEVDRIDAAAFRRIGARLEHQRKFPAGVNVEFVRRRGRGTLALWIWERGVGETPASGSGAAAAFTALRSRGRIGRAVKVEMTGGVLAVAQRGRRLAVSGAARVLFAGELVTRRA